MRLRLDARRDAAAVPRSSKISPCPGNPRPEPAAASAHAVDDHDWERARSLAAWKKKVRAGWPGVHVDSVDADVAAAHEGDRRSAVAQVSIDGLDPSDLAVQVLHGSIDSTGSFVGHPEIVPMTRQDDGSYRCDYVVNAAGPYGLTVRALPSHPAMVHPVELGLIAWAT